MRFIIFLALGCPVSNAWAGEPVRSPMEREVIAASASYFEAFNDRDTAAYERLVSGDVLFTSHDGTVTSGRQEVVAYLRMLRPGDDRILNLRTDQVRRLGDVFVLTCAYEEHEQYGATDFVSNMTATQVWTRRAGHWNLAAESVTPVPVNHRPAIQLDPRKLTEYAGRYELRPGMVEELSVQGDGLFSRLRSTELHPTYFVAPDVHVEFDDLGEAVFQRNSAGEITGYLYRSADGQFILAKKLP